MKESVVYTEESHPSCELSFLSFSSPTRVDTKHKRLGTLQYSIRCYRELGYIVLVVISLQSLTEISTIGRYPLPRKGKDLCRHEAGKPYGSFSRAH